MGSKRFVTVYDYYRADADVVIRCKGCAHTVRMTGIEIMIRFGLVSIKAASARLKCKECGHRGAALAPIPRL